jgi:S-(hydroxymethyl)glutathione dehydrogenase / alcohol dehydrogenase
MKAAVLDKLNAPLVIDELTIPNLGIGQVLVKIHISGICGKQLGEIAGHYGADRYLPHLLGHEGAGVVEETGPGVTQVQKGDHVVLHWRKGVGIEATPAKYESARFGKVGAGPVHTFCEYAVVSENRVTKIPEGIPFEIAALMGCAVTTAFGLINNEAQVKIGQSVAVYGCGGLGLAVIHAAKLAGAYPIYAIDNKRKLELAGKLGATASIFMTETSDFSIPGGVDVFVDTTGNSKCIQRAYKNTLSQGKTILVGQMKKDYSLTFEDMSQHFGGKHLFASQGGLTNPTEDIPRYLKMHQVGRLNLDMLISHCFRLDEINIALEIARSGDAVRVMVEMP